MLNRLLKGSQGAQVRLVTKGSAGTEGSEVAEVYRMCGNWMFYCVLLLVNDNSHKELVAPWRRGRP